MSIPMADTIDKLLTVEDVMENLRISRPTLYRLLKSNRLVPVRIGKRTLFDPKDIRAFVDGAKGVSEPVAQAPKKKSPKVSPKKQQRTQRTVKKHKDTHRDDDNTASVKKAKKEAPPPPPQPAESSDSGQGRLL
jgi:excisionase family DNA binding protein